MGIKEIFITKPKPKLLTQENEEELIKIKREAYMNKARLIMKEKGEQEAMKDLNPQQSRQQFYS